MFKKKQISIFQIFKILNKVDVVFVHTYNNPFHFIDNKDL